MLSLLLTMGHFSSCVIWTGGESYENVEGKITVNFRKSSEEFTNPQVKQHLNTHDEQYISDER